MHLVDVMDFLQIPHEIWREFFDEMTALLRRKLVEVEVVGVDIGDQVETEWLPLSGLTYDPGEDALYVQTGPAEAVNEHPIGQPREIFIELGPAGVSTFVVIDAESRKQFLRLRSPLELPETGFAAGGP
jgi:hypothetical protein